MWRDPWVSYAECSNLEFSEDVVSAIRRMFVVKGGKKSAARVGACY